MFTCMCRQRDVGDKCCMFEQSQDEYVDMFDNRLLLQRICHEKVTFTFTFVRSVILTFSDGE